MNMKRMISLVLAVLMLCSILSGCTEEEVQSPNATYKVTIIGVDGNPMTNGVVVKFMQNGVQQAMQTVDAGGLAAKELPKGDYIVELMFTVSGATYEYDKMATTLSAEKTELTIELLNLPSDTPRIYSARTDGDESREYTMYNVPTGKTKVKLTEGDRTFYIFAPEQPGIYEVSFNGEIDKIGYYGSIHFINNIDVGQKVEGKENTFQLTVLPGMIGQGETGTAEYVIGIDGAAGATEGILNILRVAEPPVEIATVPYERTHELQVFTMPTLEENQKVMSFDLNTNYELVLDEATGYYHLDSVDGPLVLVRLGVFSDDENEPLASLHTVIQGEGLTRWYYDENGEVVEKIGFSQCLLEYLEHEANAKGDVGSYTYVDNSTGYYPLTEDLRHILVEAGAQKGWYDFSNPGYLFYDSLNNKVSITTETPWLFICRYIGTVEPEAGA